MEVNCAFMHSKDNNLQEKEKRSYRDGPILAKNLWLFSPRKAAVHVRELGVEIEGTGTETSSNLAVPCFSCSRITSAYIGALFVTGKMKCKRK
jgi:hypothetical protein